MKLSLLVRWVGSLMWDSNSNIAQDMGKNYLRYMKV